MAIPRSFSLAWLPSPVLWGFLRFRLGGAIGVLLAVMGGPVAAREKKMEARSGARSPTSLTVSKQALDRSGRFISGLQRVVVDSNASVQVAPEMFADGSAPIGIQLPTSLGGGYLFHQRFQRIGGASTRLYRAASWTGPLEPWGTLPLAVESVVPGWDRIYFLARGRAFALAPGGERVLPDEPFPPVPSVSELRFWGEESAAIRSPLLGWLVTRDRGRSFERGEPTPESAFRAPPANEPSPPRIFRSLAMGIRFAAPLRSDGASFAFFSEDERVEAELRASEIVFRRSPRADSLGECSGLGELVARWVCRSSSRKDENIRLVREKGGHLVSVAEARGVRDILATSDDALLVDGLCAEKTQPGYCLLSDRGARDISAGSARPLAFGLAGDRVVALFREDAPGAPGFRLVDLLTSRVRSARAPDTKALRALARGAVLGPLHFTDDFGFWVTRGEEFVGLTFGASGLHAGPIQSQLRRATFAGPRALLWGAVGFGKETLDGGMTWSDLSLSSGEEAGPLRGSAGLPRVGSSRIGTLLGDRVRLGWGAPPLQIVSDELKDIPLPPLGGGRYHFNCRSITQMPLRSEDEEARDDVRPSLRDASAMSVSVAGIGGEIVLSGAPGPRFGREGRVTMNYYSPFSVERKRSKLTRGLFSSRPDAEQALGLLDSTVSYATGFLRPAGTGGVVFVRTREDLRLFAFEQEEPFYPIDTSSEVPTSGLLGVVRRHGAFHLAFSRDSRLEIFRERASSLEPFASFPLEEPTARFVGMVEDERENLALAIDGDSGLFVLPLSDDGELEGQPLVFPHQGYRPPACEDDTGYLIARDLPVSPQMEGSEGVLSLLAVRALLRARANGLCLEALSARARGPLVGLTHPGAPSSGVAGSVPLSVFGASGQPLGTLRCE